MIDIVRAAARKLTVIVAAAAFGAAVVATVAVTQAPEANQSVSVQADGVGPHDTGCC